VPLPCWRRAHCPRPPAPGRKSACPMEKPMQCKVFRKQNQKTECHVAGEPSTLNRGRARRQRAHTRPAPLDLNYRHTHARPRQSYRQHYAAMCSLSWTKLPGDHRPCQQRVAAPRDTIITVDAKFKRSLRLSIRIGDKNSGAVNLQQTGSAASWS
jgi:hypothetical protein